MTGKIAVVGCGKMGLPLAVQAASRGLEVTGVDINRAVVEKINRGECPIEEPGVGAMLAEGVRAGRLRATTELGKAAAWADAAIVVVPVLLKDKHADLGAIKAVAEEFGAHMRPGTVVSFETTLPVGTTRGVLLPLLEKGGLKAERDFYIVFSPERVKSLFVMERLNETPKLVGGVGPLSLEKGTALYRAILHAPVVSVGTLENAELAKIIDMVYRDVNIALVNEFARYCDSVGLDINEIIPAANTSGEAHLLSPGIGVGGHCTPVYPYFLIDDARARGAPQLLAETARKVNDGQAEYAVERLEKRLGVLKGKRVLLLGLGFRPGVKEDTESTAYLVRDAALRKGADVFICDPLYTEAEVGQKGFSYAKLYEGPFDAVVLVTAHKEFLSLDWVRLREIGVRAFLDGRNCYSRSAVENEGIAYIGIGNG